MTLPDSRRELITWEDMDRLIDQLLPQFRREFTAMVMITRGGIIPGGMIAEALDINYILTAAVRFSTELTDKRMAWPTFLQFPEDALLQGRRVLIVDDIWGSGRTITTVIGRVEACGARAETAVLHYKPGDNLFKQTGPVYYAAITDAVIVYPWERGRGTQGVPLPGLTQI